MVVNQSDNKKILQQDQFTELIDPTYDDDGLLLSLDSSTLEISSFSTLSTIPITQSITKNTNLLPVNQSSASEISVNIKTLASAIGTIENDDGATDNTFSNTSLISIPDSGPSTPYASTINVSGLSGNITKTTVTLNNLNHTYADDIDILLVSPTGAKTLLMSDVGSYNSLTGVTLTFDATATNSLPDDGLITSGTYKPTDFNSGDFFDSPAPGGPYNADLSVFNNTNGKGNWSLYVLDGVSPDSGSIDGGWSLTFETTTSITTNLAIAATNANQTEGNSGTKAFTFTVTRSGTTTGANDVNWAVTGTGANPANATDFGSVLLSGTVSFTDGETSKVITVNVQGDTTIEENENFTVTLSNPTNGANITTASAIGTIQNYDTNINLPQINLSSNQTLVEGLTSPMMQFSSLVVVLVVV